MPVQSGSAANARILSLALGPAPAGAAARAGVIAAKAAPAARPSAPRRVLCVAVFFIGSPRSVDARSAQGDDGAILFFGVDQRSTRGAVLHRMHPDRHLVARH